MFFIFTTPYTVFCKKKKYGRVQNLGAVKFSPFLGCMYDVHICVFTTPYTIFCEKKTEKCKILEQSSQIACLTFMRIHHTLYSLWQKKYGKVQNLGAIEFCPFLSCMYDIFVSSLLPIQSSVKKV